MPVKCCLNESSIQNFLNKNIESCKPISIPDDDKVFKKEPQPCMNYVRSQLAVRSDCTLGPVEQVTAKLNIIIISIKLYFIFIKIIKIR